MAPLPVGEALPLQLDVLPVDQAAGRGVGVGIASRLLVLAEVALGALADGAGDGGRGSLRMAVALAEGLVPAGLRRHGGDRRPWRRGGGRKRAPSGGYQAAAAAWGRRAEARRGGQVTVTSG